MLIEIAERVQSDHFEPGACRRFGGCPARDASD
jgi:hypothetical protein